MLNLYNIKIARINKGEIKKYKKYKKYLMFIGYFLSIYKSYFLRFDYYYHKLTDL